MERLPLLSRKVINKIVNQRIEQISISLTDEYERCNDPGCLTGLAGIALFFFHYGRYRGSDRLVNMGYLALEKALNAIDQGFTWPSFAAGLTGIRWTLRHLGHQGFIQPREAAALDDLNPILQQFSANQLAKGEYDVLHGGLGYFIGQRSEGREPAPGLNRGQKEREKGKGQRDRRFIAGVVEQLAALAVAGDVGTVAWESKNPKTGLAEINLGLAHGMPSILLMMSRLQQGSDEKKTKRLNDMLEGGVNFLLSCRMKQSANGSLFPHRMINGLPDQPGRMAWCYGDPGIGAALWQTALHHGRPDWQYEAMEILRRASVRVNTKQNRLHDACLCHGTAGLALIYFKMALLSNHEPFMDTASHWLRATLDHGLQSDGTPGYLFLGPGNRYIPKIGFLEGITGVGLTLIALMNGEPGGWEEALML